MKKSNFIVIVSLLFLSIVFSQCKKLTEDVECLTPANIEIKNITTNSADVSWSAAADASQYLVNYRKAGSGAGFSVLRVTSGTSGQIINLAANTTYEYKVQTNCPSSNSNYSDLKTFRTLSNNEFYIAQKWRIKQLKENNVNTSLGIDDYMDFKTNGNLEQSLTIGGSPLVTNGSWSFFAEFDSVKISLNSTKNWSIHLLDSQNFILLKQTSNPFPTTDTLALEKF